MPNAIAFFPWIHVEQPIEVGDLRLLPYQKGSLPGDLPNVSQAGIDAVLGAYANRPNFPIKKGAILEVGGLFAGMGVGPEQVDDLFRARDVLTFSALANRVLFRGHFDYCNSDAYELVVQGFKPDDPGKFSFTTRRRDTGTQHMWSNDLFAFQRPNHTSSNWRVTVDELLVKALFDATRDNTNLRESIVEFNAANTDSGSVPEHVELVMCKSAFELLFGINEQKGSFIAALKESLPDKEAVASEGPLMQTWLKTWAKSERPLIAWASEFCYVRNNAAHGDEKKKKVVWNQRTHLAFVSILFPLLVQKTLSRRGLLPLTDEVIEHLRRVESYIVSDPFDFDFMSEETHPWAEVFNDAKLAAIHRS